MPLHDGRTGFVRNEFWKKTIYLCFANCCERKKLKEDETQVRNQKLK